MDNLEEEFNINSPDKSKERKADILEKMNLISFCHYIGIKVHGNFIVMANELKRFESLDSPESHKKVNNYILCLTDLISDPSYFVANSLSVFGDPEEDPAVKDIRLKLMEGYGCYEYGINNKTFEYLYDDHVERSKGDIMIDESLRTCEVAKSFCVANISDNVYHARKIAKLRNESMCGVMVYIPRSADIEKVLFNTFPEIVVYS